MAAARLTGEESFDPPGGLPTATVWSYVGDADLPEERIGSIRCIVRVGDRIVVCETATGPHTWPGGRLEEGESHAETAAREVWEETGWRIDTTTMRRVGHLEVQPWDVVQPVYVVVGTECDDRAWRDTQGWELSSSLMTVEDAIAHVGDHGANAGLLRAIAELLAD